MTRKQYERKMMQLLRNINRYSKANGFRTSKRTDRIPIPDWKAMSESAGYPIRSYEQAWDLMVRTLGDIPDFFEGIEK